MGLSPNSSYVTSKPKKTKKDEGLWMTSFCDLSFINIAFFALMLSMSTVNTKKFEEVSDGITVSEKAKAKNEMNLEKIQAKVAAEIKDKNLSDVVEIIPDEAGVSIEFKEKVLFPSGSAKLAPKSSEMTSTVLKFLASSSAKYNITVEGHTDDIPISGGEFKSNWELSAARAITVLNQLDALGADKNRTKVAAYADTKPRVTVNGLSGESLSKARASNRRVVIRLE
ncbi:MAG: OmpA family protein [Oligoflexales bacterium]